MAFDASMLSGKHAVVTGGSRGIGLGITNALLAVGARVSVVSRAAVPRDDYFSAQADITDEASVMRAFDACRAHHGAVEILVNNSGIAESAPLLKTSRPMWDRVIATNLTGTYLCTQQALGDMISARFGRVLNVASIAGLAGAPYIAAYAASKHGVVGFTRSVAAEVAGKNILVNALCPGYTETDMMHQAMSNVSKFTGADEEAARAELAKMNPEGRIATVEEVAEAAIELLAGTRTGVAMVVPGMTLA